MKKGRILRAAMAMGMAAVLTAVPVSAFAESADEPGIAAGLEEAAWYDGSPMEVGFDVAFGDGFYKLGSENDGVDLTWLKSVSANGKMVTGEESLDGEVSVDLNDSRICQVLASYEPYSGMFYLSAPDFFEQAVAINPQAFVQKLMSGSGSQSGNEGAASMFTQMLTQAFLEIAGQVQEFYASIPAETWQEEITNYLTPIMNNLVQESSQETMTVGGLSADVTVQTISLPSEKMQEVLSSLLTTVSNDKLIESFFQSDAVAKISSMVSMLSGGSINITGQQVLDLMRTAHDQAAKRDLSQLPGVVVKIMSNSDRSAAGYAVAIETGGQTNDLYTVKAIQKDEEHAFEIIPGPMLLSMYGVDASGALDILGKGSTAGGKLNHETIVSLDDKSVAKVTITDLDLEALMLTGSMIGQFHAEFGGMTLDLNYNVKDDGTRTIEYLVNGDVFYNASMWGRAAEDTMINLIDKESALKIESVDDLTGWIGSFQTETFMNALDKAGVPMKSIAA